jgi:hypothetical protein
MTARDAILIIVAVIGLIAWVVMTYRDPHTRDWFNWRRG